MKVGAAQIRVSADIQKNLEKTALYVEEARRKRLDLVVFPECSLTGYQPHMKAAPPGFGEVQEALDRVRALAREARVSLVIGASRPQCGKLFNSSIAISRSGRVANTYDKLHLMPEEKRCYAPGMGVDVFRLERVPVGMQICLDQRFPEGWRLLAARGARVVTHMVYMKDRSWGWKKEVIEAHVRSRAAENGVFVVSANVAFSPVNHASMVVGPDGVVISRASSGGEQMVCAEIDAKRAGHSFLRGRRGDIFGRLPK
jgi:predicted amidohydrolase